MPLSYAENNLDKVIVHAEQNPVSKGLFKQTILRNEFLYSYQDLSDVLQQVAGLQVRTSSPGNPASLSIRGSTHKQITFVIDGQTVNFAQSGDFDINQIPLSQIESIEVIQGADQDATSHQSIGGTIRITTLNAKSEINTVQLSLGSFGTQKYIIDLNKEYQGFWRISLEHYKTQSNYEYPVPSPLDNPNDSNRIESIRNNAYEKNTALIKWNKEINSLDTESKVSVSTDKKQLPNYQMNSPNNKAVLSNKHFSYNTQFNWDYDNHWKFLTQINTNQSNETYKDLGSHISFKPSHINFISNQYGLSHKTQFSWDHSTIDFYMNAIRESFSEDDQLTLTQDQCLDSISICDIRSNQDQLSYKLAYKHYTSGFNFFTDLGNTHITRYQEEKYGNQESIDFKQDFTTWSLVLQYLKWQSGLISINTNKGIRIPSLYELFGDRGLVKSNAQLSAEESINISLDIDLNSIEFKSNEINFSTSLYHRQLDNAIIPIYSGATGKFENANSANIFGLQARASLSAPDFNSGINITLQDSQTQSNYASFDNKKLAGIYHKQVMIFTSIPFLVRGNLHISHEYSDQLYLDRTNNHSLETNQKTNLKVSWKQSTYIASIHINNILNNEYRDQFGRPIQDRSFVFNNYFSF